MSGFRRRANDAGDRGGRFERAWGAAACDRCGATLLLGEGSRRRTSGRMQQLCDSCAAEPVRLVALEALLAPPLKTVPVEVMRLEEAA